MPQSLNTERFLLVIGIVLLFLYGIIRLHSAVASRIGLDTAFSQGGAGPEPADTARPVSRRHGSFVLWSEKRIRAYEQALARHFDPPLGVLTIPTIGLEVPVFNGTDDLTLNRGVGRIIGTARPGRSGNTGIAGHRDGFFRGLKDIQVGDQIEFRISTGTLFYRISSIQIVTPDNVTVLENTPQPSLTLVTCYPFYFVGDAPQRYIVHGSLSARDSMNGDAEFAAR